MKIAEEIRKAIIQHEAETGHAAYWFEIEKLVAEKLRPIREALEKIIENEAPFKRDPHEFAISVIETHDRIAEEALAMFEEE